MADEIRHLRWVSDGIDHREEEALTLITGIASKQPDLGVYLPALSWMTDGVTDDELAWLAWFNETEVEWRKIASLIGTGNVSARLVHRVMQLPWMMDGIHDNELETIAKLESLIRFDTLLAERVLGTPWITRGGGPGYAQVLNELGILYRRYGDLATKIAGMQWLADTQYLTWRNIRPLEQVNHIASYDEWIAGELVHLLVGEFSQRDRDLLASVRSLAQEGPEHFQQMVREPWVIDGLDDEEMAFLITTPDIAKHSPSDLYEMLKVHHVASTTVDLPLSGRVNFWAVQKTPFARNDDILVQASRALEALEELTGVPFPTGDIVGLVVSTDQDSEFETFESNLVQPWPRGMHAGNYFRVGRDVNGQIRLDSLLHELAHYYFDFVPAWLLEGGAEFAKDYIRYRNGTQSNNEWKSSVQSEDMATCRNGAQNLHELGYPGIFYQADTYKNCFYTMGNHFLSSLFHAFGNDITKRALNDVFLLTRSFESRPAETRPVTGKDVYLAFRKYLHPQQVEELNELFIRLHGGPLAEIDAAVGDDYGNTPSAAMPLALGPVVHGNLEHPLDTDYFRFDAERGQKFKAIFQHDLTTDYYIGGDLYVRLHYSGGKPSERLKSGNRASAGVDVRWEAPATGTYYYSVESTTGLTGSYDVRLVPEGEERDDHGDGPAEATVVTMEATLEGRIDDDQDMDFFRVHVVADRGYVAKVKSVSLGYSQVQAFEADGTSKVPDTQAFQSIVGAESSWRAARDGVYFLVVDTPSTNIGAYTLTVNEFAPGGDDHGDSPASATPISPGTSTFGTLEDPFDHDYFRFQAQAGQTYHVKLNHPSVPPQPVTIYAADGVTELEKQGYTGGHMKGTYFPWIAPESEEYFLEFHSPGRQTGDYILTILRGVSGQDDHGDIPSVASDLSVGREVGGALDHNSDFDYFRFLAEAGRKYEITAKFHGKSDRRIFIYGADGVTFEARYSKFGQRQSGKYVLWEAPQSGTFYAVMFSPGGETGPYTIEVTPVD